MNQILSPQKQTAGSALVQSPSQPLASVRAMAVIVLNYQTHHLAVEKLHIAVRENLPLHEKHHLLPKTPEQLFPEGGVVLGCMIDGALGGFLVARPALSLAEAQEQGMVTCGTETGLLGKTYRDGKIWVIQAVCVDPALAGQGIFGLLQEEVQKRAQEAGVVALFAQASISNYDSWGAFVRRGFAVVTSWQGAQDGRYRVLLQNPLGMPFAVTNKVGMVLFPDKPDLSAYGMEEFEIARSKLLVQESLLAGRIGERIAAGMIGNEVAKSEAGVLMRFAELA